MSSIVWNLWMFSQLPDKTRTRTGVTKQSQVRQSNKALDVWLVRKRSSPALTYVWVDGRNVKYLVFVLNQLPHVSQHFFLVGLFFSWEGVSLLVKQTNEHNMFTLVVEIIHFVLYFKAFKVNLIVKYRKKPKYEVKIVK